MAAIDVNDGKRTGRRNKPAKMNLRVDFTPMVDMNMLLITFFMFCTTLSIPQVMDIVVPTKEGEGTVAAESKTVTLILGEEDKVYYYFGKPNYEDCASLKVTDYSKDGLRSVLLGRNEAQMAKSRILKQQLMNKEITQDEYKARIGDIRKSKDGITVMVKPTDAASYKNLVDVLDEMQLCNIGKYAIVDVEKGDEFVLANYKEKTALAALR
ncbi:ExbD/TolR family protein [Viscerimonas tarda]